MSDGFSCDVFLSHCSKDKAVVHAVAERLRADRLRVWFDDWEIQPGDSIPSKIEEGLEHSRVLVLFMSAHAFGSDWAQLEFETFRFRDPLNKQRRFITLKLDDTPIRSSLAHFRHINWLPPDRGREYPKLLQACRPPAKVPAPPAAHEQFREFPRDAPVIASHPDLARAQALNYTNPVILSIAGPGASASQNITVTSSTTPITILTPGTPTTNSGGNWLCATLSASFTIIVSVGVGCGIGTVALSPNMTYLAIVPFFVDGGAQRTLNVILTVGGESSGLGLSAKPNPLTLNVPFGAGVTSQNVAVTSNGFPITITSASASTANGQALASSFCFRQYRFPDGEREPADSQIQDSILDPFS